MPMEYLACTGKKVQKVQDPHLLFRKFCTIIYKAIYCLLVCPILYTGRWIAELCVSFHFLVCMEWVHA